MLFFFLAWPVGNMTFAIDAHDFAGIIDHGQRAIMMLPVTLEEAGRDIDVKLGRQYLHGQPCGMDSHRTRLSEDRFFLRLAEELPLEQFGRKADVSDPAGRRP